MTKQLFIQIDHPIVDMSKVTHIAISQRKATVHFVGDTKVDLTLDRAEKIWAAIIDIGRAGGVVVRCAKGGEA